jgi:prepilin-type N-terminal cleavage/methylation domain-containing protein
MKTTISTRSRKGAFTLPEMMVTLVIGMISLAGALTGHLVGIRMFQYTSTKLGGNDDARQAIAKLTQDIRSAKLIKVGTGDASSFTACGTTNTQQGNAIQVYPTTATNSYIRYFRGSDNRLSRLVSGGSSTVVLANYITNSMVFTAEDFRGNVATNTDNNRVIGLTMQFYQIEYPIIKVGPNQLYDYYQVSTRITRRTLE